MTDAEWLETLDADELFQVAQCIAAAIVWSADPLASYAKRPEVPEPLQRRVENHRRVREYFEMPRRAH